MAVHVSSCLDISVFSGILSGGPGQKGIVQGLPGLRFVTHRQVIVLGAAKSGPRHITCTSHCAGIHHTMECSQCPARLTCLVAEPRRELGPHLRPAPQTKYTAI